MEIEGCRYPDDLLYHLEFDLWARLGEEGVASVGVLASHAAFIGKVNRASFRTIEPVVNAGQGVAMLETTRYVGLVRMPVDGTVLARNLEIEAEPKLVNNSPYERGWVFRARARDAEDWTRKLETAAAVRERLADRIRTMRVRCLPAVPDVELIEVGAECAAILARLDEELARLPPNDVVLLVTDDPTSPIELERWADRTGETVLAHRVEGTLHQFLVRKEATPQPRRRLIA